MSTHKNFDKICVAVLIVTLLLTLLFVNGEKLGIRVIVDEDAQEDSPADHFTANDLNADWDASSATVITLNGSSASISGSGAYMNQGDLIIAQAGSYVLSGALTDGSVVVDTTNGSKVWLLLDGVDLYCSEDACLRADQAEKVFLTLADGSKNRMESGETYSQTALDDGTGGVIFAHDDLSINGSGSLEIVANYKHGIDANDDLVIAGGSLQISAPADAIHCNDSFRMTDASITLEAGDDGLAVSGAQGYVYLRSGSLEISSIGDAVHSAGDVILEGGSLTLNTSDDGIHADSSFSMSGGDVSIPQCYEGIEARTIELSGGNLSIYCLDDGLNANGTDAGFGGFGRDQQLPSDDADSQETWIHVSGGSLLVVNESAQDADGLDSNGDITISGGTVLVSLCNSGTNCAIDYGSESGGVCEISGGTVIACGSYSMAEGFDDSSSQCSVLYNISSGASAGTQVSLLNSSGEALLSWQVPCSFSSVILSCPEMTLGESYTVQVGDQEEAITLEEISASFGDAASSMFGGAMNWGGMQPRGGFGNGGGRIGGDGQGPQMSGGQRPEAGISSGNGEMPIPPDWSGEEGERPTPPDGEAPMGEMPSPPDMNGMPTPPDWSGEEGEMPTPPDGSDTQIPIDTVAGTNTGSASAVTGGSWLLISACGLMLLAAIFLALRFRRNG